MKSNIRVLLLSAVMFFACSITSFAQLNNWAYKVPVDINENRGESGANYVMFIDINTAQYVSNGQMQADGDDIRFSTACDGITTFPYWIESGMNTTSTRIWIRLPNLVANSTNEVLMFMGNPAATAGSSQAAVFPNTFVSSGNFTLPVGNYDYDWFEIRAGDTLTLTGNNGSIFQVNAGKLIVSGVINGNGAGYNGGNPLVAGITDGFGPGGGEQASTVTPPQLEGAAGGGAYGGAGGNGGYDVGEPFASGGTTYGSANGVTIEAGSGGGGADLPGANGGAGIFLNAFDLIVNNATINANGNDGGPIPINGQRGGGGGSGGGILLLGENVVGTSVGLNAFGGDGATGSGNSDGGGGGGGGRVKLYYYSNAAFGVNANVDPGLGGCCGTAANGTDGSAGTADFGTLSGAFTFNVGGVTNAYTVSIVSGEDTVCLPFGGGGATEVYEANVIPGFNYTWQVPSGGTIVSGQGTNIVTVNWTTGGSHNVILTDNSGSCTLSDTLPVFAIGSYHVAFGNPTDACAGEPTQFSPAAGAYDPRWTYRWEFGDSNFSNTFNPSHIYAFPGTYQVRLFITNHFGCTATGIITHTVPAKPVADFTATSECPGTAVTFTNTSTAATSYEWDFGDGSAVSTATNPTHAYTTAGTYTVTLRAISTADCEDVVTHSVTVYPVPVADFDYSGACPGDTVRFTNLSSIASGTLTYAWDFGDGNTSTSATPTNVYAAEGTYSVVLIATSGNGCADTITKPVTVFAAPTANFTATTVCEGNATAFTNTSSIATGTLSYAWDFDDGGTSTDINPTHTYAASGSYDVELTVTSNNGCTDVTTISVTVDPTPVAGFTVSSDSVCYNTAIDFNDNSTGATTYAWDFGDGTGTSNAANASYTYGSPGTYIATLVVGNASGCADTATMTIRVFDEPTADFTAGTVCEGETTQFVNNSSIGLGTLSYIWNFDDGSTSTDINPTHTYAAAGTYNVILTATSNNGCVDSITVPVTVDPTPTAAFTVSSDSVCLGTAIDFTDASTGATTFNWNFGDGIGTSNAASPTYIYTAPGTYTATLVVDNGSCFDTASITIRIFDEPTAGFTATTVCEGSTTQFTNTSSIGLGTLSYIWNFDDGSTSTDINPTHTYAAAGTYNVILTATSNNGCVDSITIPVTVNPEPIADFTVSSDSVCLGDTIVFTNGSTVVGSDILYTWSFGDGGLSNNVSVSHLYTAPGTYTAWLAATDTVTGCTDTAFQSIRVFDEPVANFTATTVCFGTATQFTNSSTIGLGTLSYLWDFNDGNFSTDINPTHTYAAAGTYNVLLTATSNNGCVDTITVAVIVNEEPVSDFSIVDADVCDGDSVYFVDNSTSVGTDIVYTWNFGDGNTSNATDPVYLYGGPGTYSVWLALTDTVTGCTDTSYGSVIVYHEPVAAWTAPDVCIGSAVTFTNGTTLGVGTLNFVWDFGDGTTSTDVNPTHTYTTDGIKTITLAVSTNNGCTDTFTNTIIVYPEPVADFSAGPACFGFPVDFTNLTTISFGSNTWLWEFGDGTTSTDSNTTHTYAAMGIYSVTLTATSNAGCTHSVTKSVQINPNPSAAFTVNTVCESDVTEFFNNSSVPTGSYTSFWDFGDGFTSQDEDPTHTYAAGGTYTATLIVTSNHGCTDTLSKTVTVIPRPVAGFTAPAVCFGEETQFTSTSTLDQTGGTIVDVKWIFGDGSVSFEDSPTHTYAAPGTYTASLVAVSSMGCRDTATQVVVVHELPDSTIRPLGPTEFCDGDSVTLSAAAGVGYSYLWSTGATTQNITVYETGTFCVTVTTQFGCVGSTCINTIKNELPIAYAGEDTTISKGYWAYLHATGGIDYVWSPADFLDNRYSANTLAYPPETQDYVVLVTDSNGCQNTDTVTIFVDANYYVVATNLITPNNDGKNDYWSIINIGTYPDCEVLIFDRWGTLVFSQEAYDNTWDGTTNDGKELGEGTYYYVIKFSGDERVYKGAVNILR